MRRLLFILTVFITLSLNAAAQTNEQKPNTYLSNLSKEQKFLYTNLTFVGAVTTYGFINWDYGDKDYNIDNEDWFGAETKEGGADKLGHLYTAYSTARFIRPFYEKWGYSHKEAAKRGVLTSFIFTTAMEVGDGFSDFGFSYEDLVANTAGQAAAYYLETHPDADDKIDLRFEYNPIYGVSSDPVTDYNSTKYLIALKMAGFDKFQDSPARYVEFHLGYYARGFEKTRRYPIEERNIYVGIGVNISQILRDLSYKKTSHIFNYYQLPYSYIEASHDLNED
ncbi:MAG: DUF2279 domain-containing protein [Proteobacteria bacterium]|nr:DUF2279 domain-containing protein [Pseudomonadota bacterium]